MIDTALTRVCYNSVNGRSGWGGLGWERVFGGRSGRVGNGCSGVGRVGSGRVGNGCSGVGE